MSHLCESSTWHRIPWPRFCRWGGVGGMGLDGVGLDGMGWGWGRVIGVGWGAR